MSRNQPKPVAAVDRAVPSPEAEVSTVSGRRMDAQLTLQAATASERLRWPSTPAQSEGAHGPVPALVDIGKAPRSPNNMPSSPLEPPKRQRLTPVLTRPRGRHRGPACHAAPSWSHLGTATAPKAVRTAR